MTWIQAIQDMQPRPERRSDQEIEDDLDAEIAFHLEQSTQDVMNERGLALEDASDIARARFGSVEQIKKRCKRIALEERIMLKRIHAVLTLLLAVGMVVTIMVAVRAVARERELAVRERMVAEVARQEVDNARQQAEAAATAAAEADRVSAEERRKKGLVFVDGHVTRPGIYNLPDTGNLTVARLLAAAGSVTINDAYQITVSDGTAASKWVWVSSMPDRPQDYVLSAGDHVVVQSSDPAKRRSAATDRARADALYDFVMTLMTEVGIEHAGDHAHIRMVLDRMEADLPTKYPNNPDLQGLIMEMIAGRRKILEHDERPPDSNAAHDALTLQEQRTTALQQQAEAERQKVEAMQRFVQDILAKSDPNAPPPVTVKELLDLASKQLGADVGLSPESREAMQKVLDEALKKLPAAHTQPATQPSSDEQGHAQREPTRSVVRFSCAQRSTASSTGTCSTISRPKPCSPG